MYFLFESIILTCIYLTFPIVVYLLYIIYTKNIDSKERKIILDFVLLTSVFLLIRCHSKDTCIYQLLFLNIPLLIAYLKKRNILAIFISAIIVTMYYIDYHISLYLLIIEYSVYYILYLNIKKFDAFLCKFNFIKAFIISAEIFIFISKESSFTYNVLLIFTEMVILSSTTYILLKMFQKAEEIIDLNITLKELEKEKSLRESLFKMTHEIKNPIAVCKGYIDMIKNSKITIDNKEKFINIIDDEITKTLLLMDDFLDYTKIKIVKEEMDVIILVEETFNNLTSLFRKNNVKFNLQIKDEEIYIEADYNRLKQVLVNVLKNSIESKKVKEKMYIDAKVINNEREVKIIIKDDGSGMDKKTLNNIKKMFYTTKSKGTGLGVPLSIEIIELHSGKMNYKSILNKGTTVTITLPK